MFAKTDIINEVVAEMRCLLNAEQIEYLQVVMTVKMSGYELVASETLPSSELRDNTWILQRYSIDLLAAGKEESTIKQYLLVLKKFFEDTQLSYVSVTGQDVMDYLAIRHFQDKITQSYKAVLQTYISAFFGWAYRKHHVDIDITRDIDKIKRTRKPKDRLTDEEVAKCKAVAAVDTRTKALLELMLSTGMRVGEIENLNIEDIDFRNDTVRIWGEKSNEERTGFLTPDCKVALKNYIGERAAGPVFLGKRRQGRLKKKTLEDIAKDISTKAECHCKATVHVYRKTFASVTYRKTGDILLVSKLLGHASTDVTIKYYLVDDLGEMKYKMKKIA